MQELKEGKQVQVLVTLEQAVFLHIRAALPQQVQNATYQHPSSSRVQLHCQLSTVCRSLFISVLQHQTASFWIIGNPMWPSSWWASRKLCLIVHVTCMFSWQHTAGRSSCYTLTHMIDDTEIVQLWVLSFQHIVDYE